MRVWVKPGNEIFWEIDQNQNHGVVFLNYDLVADLFEDKHDFDKLVPQPNFASDGPKPFGIPDEVGPKRRNNNAPLLRLKLKDNPTVPLQPIEFICNVHGVSMKGALVFEPTNPNYDKNGQIFVLRDDIPDIMAGRKPAEPIVIRANAGDVVDVTLTSALKDSKANRN